MKPSIDSTTALFASQQSPDASGTARDKKALKKSSQQFEAIFVESLFKSMRKTVTESGAFGKSNSTAIYQEMFDQEVAKNISQKQSLGLADQIYRQVDKKLPSAK